MYKNLLCILLFITLVIPSFANKIYEESLSNNTITVVYANKLKPYSYGNGSNVKGILVDIVDEILSKQLKLNVEHTGQPWKRAQKSIRTGLFDVMITAPTTDRLMYSRRTLNSIYSLQWRAFISKNSTSYTKIMNMNEPLEDRSLNFISLLGDRTSEYFYEQNNIKFQSVQNISNAIKMLDKGRMDVFIHSRVIMSENLNKLGLKNNISMHKKEYKTIPFTFLFSKKSQVSNKIIKRIDDVVNKMKKSGEYEKLIENILEKNLN